MALKDQASGMTVTISDPEAPDAALLLDALSDTLERITGSDGRASFTVGDARLDRAIFVVARDADGTPVGCGAYRPLQDGIAELKRMFAVPGSMGAGFAILRFLERKAVEDGYRALWLETRAINGRAVSFYRKHGYRRIPNYGKYIGRTDAVCFGKELDPG
ncbi:GNAT family N-acetyltransferase [Azospirillum endophyticum]